MKNSTTVTESFFAEGAVVCWKRASVEKYEIATGPGVLQTREGVQKYMAGYYIMTGPEGEQYSMPPSKFAELKDDLGSGAASPKKIVKLAKLADSNGSVATSWGERLEYTAGKDYIVRHAKGDYGVVKAEIFSKTYDHVPPERDRLARPEERTSHAAQPPRPLVRPAPGLKPSLNSSLSSGGHER